MVGMAARPHQVMRRAYQVRGPDDDDRVTNSIALKLKEEALREFRDQLVVGAPSNKQQKSLREFRDQLATGLVQVRFFARYPLHAKMYLAHLPDGQVLPRMGYVGSSNLTFSGLAGQGELNVDVPDHDASAKLLAWFEDRWIDDFAIDVTDDLVEILDESWVSEDQPDPYLVYLKLAYELSSDAREGLRDYDIPASLRGVLLQYQADAVRVAARIIERRGGVMIGDVVGLGKTLIATAIARVMFEQHNTETLVICPKNLVSMWKDYLREFQIVGDVVSLSMAHADLPDRARFRLVIVDESHNLRNPDTQQWHAVRDYIERNDPRVVLLTATPYNKAFTDASGQLRLWLNPDEDLGIRPEQEILDSGETEVAKRADGRLSTLRAFESSTSAEDWQRLMSLFLIRRTRKFVEHQHGEQGEDGRVTMRFADGTPFYFPKRLPKPLEYAGGPGDPGDRLASTEVVDQLNDMRLPRYRLGDFLVEGAEGSTEEELEILERLERSRGNLLGFIRTTLLKRLASCGQSFMVSVERHLLRTFVVMHAFQHGLPVPIGTVEDRRWERLSDTGDAALDGLDIDLGNAVGRTREDWEAVAKLRYETLEDHPPAGLMWLGMDFFEPSLGEDLETDIEILQTLLDEHGPWDPSTDSKIEALSEMIEGPHAGEKVLVFSEYADTAEYVGQQLQERLTKRSVGVATGETSDPTTLARRFSPASNATIGGLPAGQDELDVLVATDVLSEGQNLQDCAIVVNYDLPWTIIKLVQRAGRVDRVGQAEPEVFVYSFLPQQGVETVIALRERIRTRLKEQADVFGSDEKFFEDDLTNDGIRGLFDGSATLDEVESEEDVDWASQALAIWEEANAEQQESARALPNVTYSTRKFRDGDEPGCLTYTRTTRGIDGLAHSSPTMNHGESVSPRILTPSEALRIAQCEPGEPVPERRLDHHKLVEKAVTTSLLESAKRPLAVTHSGPRARLYKLMRGYRESHAGTLYDTPELRNLIERILHTPLKESAKHRIVKALRERDTEDVVALAVDLDDQDALLVEIEESEDEIRIVCSMGITDK